jgi:hypothetical protein
MVLFPIAFIWLLAVMIWLIRNSLNNEPAPPGEEPRRWRPRPPRRPDNRRPGGSRAGNRSSTGASR